MGQAEVAELLATMRNRPAASSDAPFERHHPPPDFGALSVRIGDRFPALQGRQYPAVLRNLYQYVFPGIDAGVIRLVPSRRGQPTAALERLVIGSWDPAVIAGRGLLAIAEDGNDGGPLCLDTTRGLDPECWPVVLWDHDERNTTEVLYSSASRLVASGAYLLSGGALEGLGKVDPAGAAADYYAFLTD